MGNHVPLTDVIERLDKIGFEFIKLSDENPVYKKQTDKVIVKCKKCNSEFEGVALRLLQKQKNCPFCTTKSQFLTEDLFIRKLKESNLTVEYVDGYNGLSRKCNFKCAKCGKIFSAKPNLILKDKRNYCSNCNYTNAVRSRDEYTFNKNKFFNTIKKKTNLKVIGEYKSYNEGILLKCNKCGNEWMAIPRNIVSGTKCPLCQSKRSGLKLSLTDKEFRKRIYDMNGDEYTVLGRYINNRTHIKVRHNKCGKIWNANPSSLLSGSKCPYCVGHKRLTTDEFKERVFKKYGDEYTVTGNYVNNTTRITVIHNKCNFEYEINPASFLKGQQECPMCNMRMIYYDDKLFKSVASHILGDEYIILDKYINSTTPVRIKHTKCNNIFKLLPKNITMKRLNHENYTCCPYCGNRIKKTTKKFKKEIYEIYGDRFTVIGKYKNKSTKIKIRCNECNTIFKCTPSNLLQMKANCPICSVSGKSVVEKNFETSLMKIYNNEIISNTREIIAPQELDFYIPGKKIGIEIDGIYWHSNKFRDKDYHYSKNNECNKKAISLIHITEPSILFNSKNINNYIKRTLNINTKSINIKNCKIKIINEDRYKSFYEKYNITNYKFSNNNYMLFGIYRKNKDNNKYYLKTVFKAIIYKDIFRIIEVVVAGNNKIVNLSYLKKKLLKLVKFNMLQLMIDDYYFNPIVFRLKKKYDYEYKKPKRYYVYGNINIKESECLLRKNEIVRDKKLKLLDYYNSGYYIFNIS